ncbi:MAG: hypothetical protein KGN36_17920 [Acidobacteriota bacterium]|nr:hypothetical protein [Acidobacteriota bacterium]
MRHFDTAEWADYARGVVQQPEKEAMERHLASGCEECTELAGLMRRVWEESRAEVSVPASLVRAAEAVFHGSQAPPPASDWTSVPRLAARLVFSTLSTPALEGARSAGEAVAQAVYHAGNMAIDLQVDCEPESTEVTLVGQVLDMGQAGKPVEAVPVMLTARKKVVTSSRSNRFGEFCLVSRVRPGLTLCVHLESDGRRVEIPLTKLMAGIA